MKILRSAQNLQRLALGWGRRGMSVGLVPTMGALHEGHLSLVRRARRENQVVVVSVFVNPSQFGPAEDFKRYPRPWLGDRALLEKERVDVLFAPAAASMYPPGFDTWVQVEQLSKPLCGAVRPGHFRGVATVVAQLFHLSCPTRAYFGAKDFQQVRVIEQMVKDLHFPLKIVVCPTLRDKDGVALSSRNAFLSPAERRAAQTIPAALRWGKELVTSGRIRDARTLIRTLRRRLAEESALRVQYLEVVDPKTLAPLRRFDGPAVLAVAVFAGHTRLIDHCLIRP